MKSEPSELSIDDLKTKKRWHWDGVRGYEARNFMRDNMQISDGVIFYHSSCETVGAAGIARVCSLPYPDHTQFDKNSPYFDATSTRANPRWIMVDVAFVKKFKHIVSRDEMKKTPALRDMLVWKKLRLSIVPILKKEFDAITVLGANE